VADIETPGPYTLTLVVLNPARPRVIRYPINPESYERSFGQAWKDRGVIGQRSAKLDWEGNAPTTNSFTAIVQAPEEIRLEADFLHELEGLKDELVPETQEPPLVIATFGTKQYKGAITQLTVRRLRQNRLGDALQAEVSITLTENDK
jgi:hypothetical protein